MHPRRMYLPCVAYRDPEESRRRKSTDGMEEDQPRRLPDDVLADILSRLAPAPRSLAVSRCVCREWRAVVDDRCLHLLRPDLLLLTVGGIFVDSYCTYEPDFFARPSTARGRWVAGRLESFVRMDDSIAADYTEIMDCCNGLLLLEEYEVIVVNPATRRSARLPRCVGVLPVGHKSIGLYWNYLAFDPTLSPHYEVISMQHDPFYGDEEKKRLEGLQWPPPVYVMRAYSSRTGSWEERRFALDDDEGLQRSIDVVSVRPYGHAAYWRGVLYVHCNSHFILRINLSDDKYQVIDLPADATASDDLREVYLGKSKNGIYFAAIVNDTCRVLVLFLDESDGKMEWVFKSIINQHDLITPFWDSPDAQTDRPWILHDDDLHQEFKLGPIVEVEKNLGGDSEDEKAVEIKDYCDTNNTYRFMIFGFHPYKEIVFLHSSRVVAYHFGSSKVQDLGELPLRFRYPHRMRSFVYTPCWLGDLSETSY
ncbi:F-box protein At5g07610-like [Miscanthus floridulus]|uniref:F-box protein At5g07610-like n=1 Tax=Miscanthus floridulus TaxID=154761 RepID=UPI00345A5624